MHRAPRVVQENLFDSQVHSSTTIQQEMNLLLFRAGNNDVIAAALLRLVLIGLLLAVWTY